MNLHVVTPSPARAARASRPRRVQPVAAPVAQVLPLALGDLVPVERLTSLEQRFACVPLSARLSAKACLERQALSLDTRARAAGMGAREAAPAHRYQTCRECSLGEQVAARLRGVSA